MVIRSRRNTRSPLKAKPLRLPGQSLDEARLELFEKMVETPGLISMVLIIMAFTEWVRHVTAAPTSPVLYSVIAVISFVFSAWRFLRYLPKARALRQGIEGEKVVGQYLEALRERGYRVFHDLLGTGFNVDHVLIGPAGIFTVETKTWSKPATGDARIRFDGESIRVGTLEPDRNPVIQGAGQASWLREVLKESTGKAFAVCPVIVFPGWFVEQVAHIKRDVWVLNPKALPGFLDKEPRRLSEEDAKLASYHLSRFIRSSESDRR